MINREIIGSSIIVGFLQAIYNLKISVDLLTYSQGINWFSVGYGFFEGFLISFLVIYIYNKYYQIGKYSINFMAPGIIGMINLFVYIIYDSFTLSVMPTVVFPNQFYMFTFYFNFLISFIGINIVILEKYIGEKND